MILKWIRCVVRNRSRADFSRARGRWAELAELPGFAVQWGGWSRVDPERAEILGFWRSEIDYEAFRDFEHDTITAGQETTYEECTTTLFDVAEPVVGERRDVDLVRIFAFNAEETATGSENLVAIPRAGGGERILIHFFDRFSSSPDDRLARDELTSFPLEDAWSVRGAFPEITVRDAKPSEAAELSELVLASKRVWDYPEEWIELWKSDLAITPELVSRQCVFVAERKGRRIGLFALVGGDEEWELEHLWLLPEEMGKGLGRVLFRRATAIARAGGASRMRIVSDPNAAGFYVRMGARRLGTVPAKPAGRELPELVLDVNPKRS